MLAAVNVLPNSTKMKHLTKSYVLELDLFGLIWNYVESSVVLISAVIVIGEHVDSAKVF